VISVSGSNAREALAAAVEALAAVGVEDPRLDAELLLAEATGRDRASLIANPATEVPPPSARLFGEMVRRRLQREPVAYILGRKAFRQIEVAVDPRVLIPAPETEMLVDVALEMRPRTVLDVGTGSGAIALAVVDELPECIVTATDTSPVALEVARANAENLGFGDRVRFLEGSLPDSGEFDLILANLPYVAEGARPSLQPEVNLWEPSEAVFSGSDGLEAYRALFSGQIGPHALGEQRAGTPAAVTGGAIAVEVGEGQAPAMAALMRGASFGEIETRRDLAGIERVVLGRVGGAV
jgi:release factor glutamine methyltransferase